MDSGSQTIKPAAAAATTQRPWHHAKFIAAVAAIAATGLALFPASLSALPSMASMGDVLSVTSTFNMGVPLFFSAAESADPLLSARSRTPRTVHPAALLSFMELRRCLLGEWPTTFALPPRGRQQQRRHAKEQLPDAASCIRQITASRSVESLARSDVCTADPGLGSRGLRAALKRYVALTHARQASAALFPTNSSSSSSPPVNLLLVQCHKGYGGLGDKLKGLALALFMAIAPRAPRYFLFDCDSPSRSGTLPFSSAWAPCPGRDGHDWAIPKSWDASVGSARKGSGGDGGDEDWLMYSGGQFSERLSLWSSAATPDAQTMAVAMATADVTNASLILYHNNMFDPWVVTRQGHAPRVARFGNASWFNWIGDSSSSSTGGIPVSPDLEVLTTVPACGGWPAELRGLVDGPPNAFSCAVGLEEAAARAAGRAEEGINASAHMHLSESLLPGRSYGAGNANVLYQLFNFFMWPTHAFVQRLLHATAGDGHNLVSSYRPGAGQFVIAIHLRIGSSSSNADYNDADRYELNSTVEMAARCADAALEQLIAASAGGAPRREVLWYVASDRPEAVAALRIFAAKREAATTAAAVAAEGGANHSAIATLPAPSEVDDRGWTRPRGILRSAGVAQTRVRIVDLGIVKVLHTDNSPSLSVQQQQPNETDTAEHRWMETFVDHFLLTAAHAQVRTYSGFNRAAAAWGRVPLVYEIDARQQQCLQLSHHAKGPGFRRRRRQ